MLPERRFILAPAPQRGAAVKQDGEATIPWFWNGDSVLARSGTAYENLREVRTPERMGDDVQESPPRQPMDTAKLRRHFLAFGSLPRRKEIEQDTRQPEIDEVQFPSPFSCNGMQQW